MTSDILLDIASRLFGFLQTVSKDISLGKPKAPILCSRKKYLALLLELRYDEQGWLVSATTNGKGQITGYTDRNGNSVRYTVDSFGNILSYTDSRGNTTTCTYDSIGNCTSVTDTTDSAYIYAITK